MRLPVRKQKTMLAQAIVLESAESAVSGSAYAVGFSGAGIVARNIFANCAP